MVLVTSAAMGVELGAALAALPEVRTLTVVTTRVKPGSRSLREKLRGIYRHDGIAGVARSAMARLTSAFLDNAPNLASTVALRCPGARHLHCDDLHAPESLALLRSLRADLGVVFAAYRLKPEVFTIPRLGCLNLHLGHAPEFRGSSPAFYELLEGVPSVGITVHRITEGLDAGPIIAQESFPLDLTPAGDPVEYVRQYQLEVLIPNGIRLMTAAVRRFAVDSVPERPQSASASRVRRRATTELKRELRRRVAVRRQAAKQGVFAR